MQTLRVDERSAKLGDKQAVSSVGSLTGELARDDLRVGRGGQASALDTLFELGSQPATANVILEAGTHAAAGAARKLRMLSSDRAAQTRDRAMHREWHRDGRRLSV